MGDISISDNFIAAALCVIFLNGITISIRNKFNFWLFNSSETFFTSIKLGIFFWLSWAPSYFANGRPVDLFGIAIPEAIFVWFFTALLVLVTLGFLILLFQQTASDVYDGSKLDVLMVCIGQILFAIFAIVVVFLLIFGLASKKDKKES